MTQVYSGVIPKLSPAFLIKVTGDTLLAMFGRLTWGEAEGKLGAFTFDESAGGCRCTAVRDTHTVNGHSCGACMYVIV